MTEFKYACPYCGQHICCSVAQSGTMMECPTCFQNIIAPQAPASADPKFILTGTKATRRSPPLVTTKPAKPMEKAEPAGKKFPVLLIAAVVMIGAAVAGAIVFRGKIFKSTPAAVVSKIPPPAPLPTNPPPVIVPAMDRNWTLNLNAVVLPDTPAAGRINGKKFTCQRATLQSGTLHLRQDGKWPPDLGVSINLHAVRSADLAGQTVNIATNLPSPPRVTLRWKDEKNKPVTKLIDHGYALRIEFGPLAGNRLPGKIYLSTPDEPKSYVAGAFTAEIQIPRPSNLKY